VDTGTFGLLLEGRDARDVEGEMIAEIEVDSRR
jgi:hypothetical protein